MASIWKSFFYRHVFFHDYVYIFSLNCTVTSMLVVITIKKETIVNITTGGLKVYLDSIMRILALGAFALRCWRLLKIPGPSGHLKAPSLVGRVVT